MPEPLLTKDAINVGGHKLPIPLIGALAALLGVVLFLRARQSGKSVSAGAVPAGPYSAAQNGFGNFSPDYSAALANISQQLTSLSQSSINSPAQTASLTDPRSSSPPDRSQPSSTDSFTIRPRLPKAQWDWSQGVPIFGNAGDPWGSVEGYVPFGTRLVATGAPVQGGSIAGTTSYYPIRLPGGGTALVSAADVQLGLTTG